MASKRLVVVDDKAEMGDFIRAVAEPLGYVVETYTKAQEFVAAVGRADPDVIILDLVMPDVDGIELLNLLAARPTGARIFIASGYDPAYQRMAKALGEAHGLAIAGIISKPMRAADLKAALVRQLNEPPAEGGA